MMTKLKTIDTLAGFNKPKWGDGKSGFQPLLFILEPLLPIKNHYFLKAMLTDRKYKSDKILKPVIIALIAIIFTVNFFSERKVVVIGLLFIWISLTLGVMIYRFNKEGKKRYAIYSLLALLLSVILIFLGIFFQRIRL